MGAPGVTTLQENGNALAQIQTSHSVKSFHFTGLLASRRFFHEALAAFDALADRSFFDMVCIRA